MIRLRTIFLLFAATAVTAKDEIKIEDPGLVVFRDRCMACHLESGMGILEMNAPSIAGLPRWYVSDQLRKFRRDQRGFHKDDDSGHLMQANAAALDERSIAFVGRHIENLAPNKNRNTLNLQNAEMGKQLYKSKCLDCHGDKAEGIRTKRIPPMTSQQDWYLLRQLENFQSGKRIHYESASKSLSENERRSIVAWISLLQTETSE